ncbi:hypothetical protein [Burkholderia anthina]|uniref:hypothetical protein n=1 Tax=Burkholderia anthina TaxID=179879 RepID=UPI001FB760D9|nr:hypothetical protein [Burkholderia anthina]
MTIEYGTNRPHPSDYAERRAKEQIASRADALTETAKETMNRLAREFAAMSPFEQRCSLMRNAPAPRSVSHPAPSPDPCAHDYVRKDLVCTECGEKVTSANETDAEGAAGLAHELWTAAQLAPGEGIEDGVHRIEAIVSRSPAMAAAAPALPIELSSVAETVAEGAGFWRSCSGCHETNEGHETGHYPYSKILKCHLGGGCSECGGIGAVWDDTDYEAMGRDLGRSLTAPQRASNPAATPADEPAAFDLTDAEWLDVFERVSASIPNLFGGYMKVRAAFAREAIRLADESRAAASPAADVAAIRNAALDEAATAVADHQRKGREWIPTSLWGTLTNEAANRIRALKSAAPQPAHADAQAEAREPFQARVQPWMLECFGPVIAADRIERNHRFLEEALELVQALGCTASEAHQLVDYTFGRPLGEPTQEVGGVMVTLAALCLANGLDMHAAGETELARISVPETIAKIRAKQAAKPKHSPLPIAMPGADRHPYQWRDTGALETGDA